MIKKEEPKNFNPVFEVVASFCENQKKILLLHRQDKKPEGNTWGLPAGKIQNNENLHKAIKREINEETGLNIGDFN